MAVVWAHLDRDTSEGAGAGGTFQVISLSDDGGADLSDLVDAGMHFGSIEQLEEMLSKAMGDDVTVEEQ